MINDILNGLGVIKHRKTALRERSGSSASSRSTTATADARYTVALPNGQIASNLTQAQYDTIKALLDIYSEAFALAKSNGLSVPNWGEYTKIETAKYSLAKLKAQIQAAQQAAAEAAAEMQEEQKNESAKTTPPEVVMPTVQPPEEKQGSGILVPALIFAVGAIAAIVLVKSKPKRR